MLRRLLSFWGSARRDTLLGGSLLVAAGLVDLLQPWPVKWLVDYVFGSHTPPGWLDRLWPALGRDDPAAGISAVCLSILGLALLHRATITLGHLCLIRAGARLVQALRARACEHLHRLSLAYHDRTKVGDSMYRVAYDSHAVQALLNGALVPIATGVLLLAGAVLVMLRINVLLTVVTLLAAPLFLVIIRGFSRRLHRDSQLYHQSESALAAIIQESLSSIRAIQAFTLESRTDERFRGQAEESRQANQRLTRTQLLYSACAGLAASLGTAAVVYTAGHQVLQGRLSIGDILVFLAYLGMLYQPMNTFSQSASVIQSARAQLQRVFDIMDSAPDIRDRPHARAPGSVRGAVEFRDVSFAYAPGRPVLQDIRLRIEPGQVVALVGRTGAGKTSLASLLMRFYDPTAGAILLDDHDLRDLPLQWLRRQISVVLQDPILLSSSIAENIGYGRPDASMEAIRLAARRAQADEFISSLPDGYQTQLGERGVNLSGGQRQRLAIARAFLKDAPVLILDEPTSALDTHTEEALLASLRELRRDRTSLIIAHRLSTVREADRIVVLDQGRIVESGRHEDLLPAGGPYAKMYRSQFGAPLESPATVASTAT